MLLGALLAGSLAVLLGTDRYLQAALERQAARNAFLQAEIALLDTQIDEIRNLREHRAQLLERLQVIQDLQDSRPVIARVLDQLVRTLPDGLYFTALQRRDEQISSHGMPRLREP